MAASRPLFLGPRLRRLRRELGLTQQAIADDLGISASYVALLERNQRPVTADLLLRLARGYQLDVAEFASEDSDDYARRLTETLRDPIFAGLDLPVLEVSDLAASFPGASEALLRLHAAYVREQRALAEQQASGSGDEADPLTETHRFIATHRNHFSALDAQAEEVAAEIAARGGPTEWLRARGTRVRIMPAEVLMDTVRRYDRHNAQLLIADTLDAVERDHQVMLHVTYTALRSAIAAALRETAFTTPTAASLARRALTGYGADALAMPYGLFARTVEECAYDIEVLAHRFAVDFARVAQRLTTLHRPGHERVPFVFLRVDRAGNVSRRLDGTGLAFAAHGGSCPLWSIHGAAQTPGRTVTQWLELPGGDRFFSIARAASTGAPGWGQSRHTYTVALACAAEYAPRLVYAWGSDPAAAVATPIGVACRLCDRAECTARAAPPVGREILPDDYRRTWAPYTFAED